MKLLQRSLTHFRSSSIPKPCPPPRQRVAKDILAGMPSRALNLIQSSAFMGADLVRLESDIHRPSFRETGSGEKKCLNPVSCEYILHVL